MYIKAKSDLDPAKSQAANDFPTGAIPFEFKGTGREYFRVWIVNILLTVLTIGIYGAWAKVRNRRYFYGNTFLDDRSFEYLATGGMIFRGRVIAGLFFVVFNGLVTALEKIGMTSASLWFLLLLFLLIPWVIVRSLTFNAQYSAYANLNFGYSASYAQAAFVHILLLLLSVLTLGLLYPFYTYYRQHLIANYHNYGTAKFRFSTNIGQYYAIFARVSLMLIIYLILLGTVIFASGYHQVLIKEVGKILWGEQTEVSQQIATTVCYEQDYDALDNADYLNDEAFEAILQTCTLEPERELDIRRYFAEYEMTEKEVYEYIMEMYFLSDAEFEAILQEYELQADSEQEIRQYFSEYEVNEKDLREMLEESESFDKMMLFILQWLGIAILSLLPLYFVISTYLKAQLTNLVYNNTTIDGHGFNSTLKTPALLWIYSTNLLLIVCTLGLAAPWAMVRSARYLADNLELLPSGDLDNFIADNTEKALAQGQEMGEMMDLDIGL